MISRIFVIDYFSESMNRVVAMIIALVVGGLGMQCLFLLKWWIYDYPWINCGTFRRTSNHIVFCSWNIWKFQSGYLDRL